MPLILGPVHCSSRPERRGTTVPFRHLYSTRLWQLIRRWVVLHNTQERLLTMLATSMPELRH